MKFIDTKTHGCIDYLMGILLIAAPSLWELNSENPESSILYVLGVTMIIYSALTHYELGLIKMIPMKVHLFLDVASGIFLAASPWLFNFENAISTPYVVLGVLEIGVGLVTSSRPQRQVEE